MTQLSSATQRSLRNEVEYSVSCDQRIRGETHDEPVSKITLKETGGVPIANDPK
jgi:hypothetical protein